jgi:protein-S-isoprenylcysteine O-methyltransferase Ste14
MTAALFVLAQLALFGIFAFSLVFLPTSNTPASVQIGAAIALFGVGTAGLAIIEHLQRNASLPNIAPVPNQRAKLVTSGLYRFARHPIYTGVLCAAFGAALAHGSPIAIAIAVLFIPFFTLKSMYEEKLLRAVYPDYDDYARRTGRFFPGRGR